VFRVSRKGGIISRNVFNHLKKTIFNQHICNCNTLCNCKNIYIYTVYIQYNCIILWWSVQWMICSAYIVHVCMIWKHCLILSTVQVKWFEAIVWVCQSGIVFNVVRKCVKVSRNVSWQLGKTITLLWKKNHKYLAYIYVHIRIYMCLTS